MQTITIQGGTPQGGESLCRTCRWVHLQKGYRQSEESIICDYVYPSREVLFSVRECTSYRSSITPSPKQMEEIALIIPTEPARKAAGFAGMGFEGDASEEEKRIDDVVA